MAVGVPGGLFNGGGPFRHPLTSDHAPGAPSVIDDFLFGSEPVASDAGYIPVWTGAADVRKPVKAWTGAAWVIKPAKRRTATDWSTT
jgi:hypothetical protein